MSLGLRAAVHLGPSVVYALAAVFLLCGYLLGQYPTSEGVWQAYMTSLPIFREPMYLLVDLPFIGYGGAFLILCLATLVGIYLVANPTRHPVTMFIHSHLAFLAMVMAMGRANAHQASVDIMPFSFSLLSNWMIFPERFPAYGNILFYMVITSCALVHLMMIARIARNMKRRVANAD